MKVDKDSRTWRAVEDFIASEKQDAINALIADMRSEQQRGAIAVLERLAHLAREEDDL